MALQVRLGRFFKDPRLLEMALTHPSAALEAGGRRSDSNERLEFLGDALLGILVAEILFEAFPDHDEGALSKLRAHWVSRETLSSMGRRLGVHEAIRLGVGEERQGGRAKARLAASALEALAGALYLDSGWRAARSFVRGLFREPILRSGLSVLELDHKTLLQERMQARGRDLPIYRTEPTPDGFQSEVFLNGISSGSGAGPTRKAAEQAAARAARENLPR